MREEKRKIIFGFVLILTDRIFKEIFYRNTLGTINKGLFFGKIYFDSNFIILFHLFLVVLSFGLYFYSKKNRGLFFIVCGGVGNFLDRIIYGGVIDFIKLPFIPIFNLADLMITFGAVYYFIDLIRKKI